jgi:hypothetical protein
MTILGLNKQELRFIFLALFLIISITALNMRTSLRKSRDAQRKNDIRSVYDALLAYQNDFGAFPESDNGKIKACKGELGDKGIPQFRACEWYKDGLRDIFDDSYKPYLNVILGDPRQGQGFSYYYLSNSKHFQVFASLEGENEDEFDPKIVARSLPCGQKICNFGRSDGATPLDKSLEEYENELERLKEENEK